MQVKKPSVFSLSEDLLARWNSIFFPPYAVFIKKIDSECVSVKVLTKLLDFKIDFKNVKTREKYESDELCLY